MKHLKKFNESNRYYREGLTPLNAGPINKHKYTDEELFEEIEDRLESDGIFDKWNCISKKLTTHPIHTNQPLFKFEFDTKSTIGDFQGGGWTDKLYLYPKYAWINKKSDYRNSEIFDKEVEEMKRMINWKIIQHLGVRVDRFWWLAEDVGVWGGIEYAGKTKEKAVIILEFTRPSWWDERNEPIPYKEVSDKEAGII